MFFFLAITIYTRLQQAIVLVTRVKFKRNSKDTRHMY